MKKFKFVLIAGTIWFAACTSSPNGDEAQTTASEAAASIEGQVFAVDTSASSLEWYAAKQTGKHNGEFVIEEGILSVDNGNLTGGKFDINVAALKVSDLEGEDKQKLEGHLKSGDFLQVDQYPTAKFTITNVAPAEERVKSTLNGATHTVSGNLTLKDSTKNVTFPAKISIDENKVEAVADLVIDRTEWGLNYKGPNNPQDWFIKKDVNLKLDLVATKK